MIQFHRLTQANGSQKGPSPSAVELLVTLVISDDLEKDSSSCLTPVNRKRAIQRGFTGKRFETLRIELDDKALLLIGWNPSSVTGSSPEIAKDLIRLGGAIGRHAKDTKTSGLSVTNISRAATTDADLQLIIQGMCLAAYEFSRYKSKKSDKADQKSSKKLGHVWLSDFEEKVIDNAAKKAGNYVEAIIAARDLVNLPPCDCVPSDLVDFCKSLAKRSSLKIEVFDRKKLSHMGANLILAVANASKEPPYIIHLTYKPASGSSHEGTKKVALVGKGITFDSGGLSIKSGAGMEDMKIDMAGAAAVIGAMMVIGAEKPKNIEVHAFIPTCENMVSSGSVRPGDVVKSLNGKTVEILNTDAEGRLILADALTLACQEKPDVIIDAATLTGAIMAALGLEIAGLFANDDDLATALTQAASETGESVWRMPLPESYRPAIKSPIADIKNTGNRYAGAITAALFLKEFVGKHSWAHLDIAGVVTTEKDRDHLSQGATGFGVSTLAKFVMNLADSGSLMTDKTSLPKISRTKVKRPKLIARPRKKA